MRSGSFSKAKYLAVMAILVLAPLASFMLPGAAGVSASGAAITNGSFETGDYTGWTLWEGGPYHNYSYGTWGIAGSGDVITYGQWTYDFFDRTQVRQTSPGLPRTYAATDGHYLAYQLQNGGENHRLYQDVTVPAGSASLAGTCSTRTTRATLVPATRD